ncbi:unnamed protein product [Meganyctiphanes norvegica]|uniref:TOG domain-containing protein n=1 Tax=Meganyctiphanes norvegica TaxID=48144 RepID=A0AAV2Q871_MEGNR
MSVTVSQLRTAGERLGKYEIEKRHAIETENFERAKLKKGFIEDYREQVYRALEIDDLLERKGKLDKNDVPGPPGGRELPPPPVSKAKSPRDPSPVPAHLPHHPSHLPPPRPANSPPKPPPSPPKSPSPPPIKTPSAPLPDLRSSPANVYPSSQVNSPRPNNSPRRSVPNGGVPGSGTPSPGPAYTSPSSAYSAYDERQLPALKHRSSLERSATEPEVGSPPRPRLMGLTEADKKDAALPIEVFGPGIVEKIFSKNFHDKESGLREVQDRMSKYSVENTGVRPDRFVRASSMLLRRALKDKVYSVALEATHTLTQLVKEFFQNHRVSRKEMTGTIERVLPELLTKTCDNATRTQALAVNSILELLKVSHEKNLVNIGLECTRPLTNTVHPRGALCRAQIVDSHLTTVGLINLPKDKDSGFTVRQIVEFGNSAFKHQNNEVRKMGENILLRMYKHFPSAVRRALPLQDELLRKNVLWRNLFDQLEEIDNQREINQSQHSSPSSQRVTSSQPPPQPHVPSTTPSFSSTPNSSSGFSSSSSTSSTGYPTVVPQICITPDEQEVRGRCLSRLNSSNINLRDLEDETPSPIDPEDKTCIFCGIFDPNFSDVGLDLHYWKSCPMLTRCTHCKQVVEIASLTQHLLGECDSTKLYRKCERCSEAIPKNNYSAHVLAKTCTNAKPEPIANHCPLCHENIRPWDHGWREHLMPGPDACSANPRAKQPGSRKTPVSDKSSSPSPVAMGYSASGSARNKAAGSSTPGTPRRSSLRRHR